MQIDLPFSTPPEEVSGFRVDWPEPSRGQVGDASDRVDFVRVRRARRYVMRVRPDGTLRVTIPRGGSRAEAIAFMERHASWITRERARVRTERAPVVWTHGSTVLLRGLPQSIDVWHDGSAFVDVCDYVLIHELMHLRQQNHGRRFWTLVERACPDYRAAERWLRQDGRGLF